MADGLLPERAENILGGLRDGLRSARRWRDLLSEADRTRMLADIATVALAIGRDLHPDHALNDLDVGDSPARTDICPRERLAYLAEVWPQIARALNIIEATPQITLRPEKRLVPLDRARRVTPRDALEALRRGAQEGRRPGTWPEIAETVMAPCADTPANRSVKAILAIWSRDLADITALAQVCDAGEVARESERLRLRIRAALRREPWRTLPLVPVPVPLPPALRTHGAYRLVHDAWRRYRRGFSLVWSNPLFSLPARETWLLYEYWGLFQIAAALRTLGYRTEKADDFALSRGGLTFTLARGRASRLRFHRPGGGEPITLTYRREFPRADAVASSGWHSRSHALCPDITLEAGGRLLIFDTKFKTYGEQSWTTDDIRQMHSYRDAIRRGDDAPTVQSAWLLYAGRRYGENRPVIAFPASTPERPFGNGEVGALLLRPADVQPVLTAFLAAAYPPKPKVCRT